MFWINPGGSSVEEIVLDMARSLYVSTARLSIQLDFQEDFDAARDDKAWISSPEAPQNWRAEYFPDGGHQVFSTPFGQPPYDNVESRGIPMLREEIIAPSNVTSQGIGICSGE